MKTIKDLLTAFLLTSFLVACNKNNEIKYTVKGRLMHDCGVPAANVTDVSFKQHGQPLFGQKGMFLSFNTDAEGYFEVVYNRKDANTLDMEILKSGPILEGIPAMKNLDLGEVFWGVPSVSFVIRLEAINAYTNQDTLIVPNYNDIFNENNNMIYFAGPFVDEILDTVWNYPYMKSLIYNSTPEMHISSRKSTETKWNKTYFDVPDFCTDELYEAVIKIE